MSETVSTHPLVKAASNGPEKPRETTPVVGYIGPSERAGHKRIYNDLSLENYLEVPEDSIKKVEPLDKSNEHSPTVAYVKSGTQVHSKVSRQHPVESGFLNGLVTGSYLQDAEPGHHRNFTPTVLPSW